MIAELSLCILGPLLVTGFLFSEVVLDDKYEIGMLGNPVGSGVSILFFSNIN
jgi:hypothetical protein